MKTFSPLGKTWLLDVDGTLLKHNGYLSGDDEFLPGAEKFLRKIPPTDKIILLTSRKTEFKDKLSAFFSEHNLHFDEIICDLPPGERILINDCKPSGLKTAFAINKSRDSQVKIQWKVDDKL